MEKSAADDKKELPAIRPNTANPELPNALAEKAAKAHNPALDKYVEFSQVTKIYPTPKGPLTVVDEFDLKMKKGEFISIIGHSGCGKSTVLSMVAGLNSISGGGIILDGKEVTVPGPERAVVFQNHSLLPWLSAFQNVELAVNQVFGNSKSKAEKKEWIEHNLKLVHMDHAMHKRPDEISGGMKQRVGIARALSMQLALTVAPRKGAVKHIKGNPIGIVGKE